MHAQFFRAATITNISLLAAAITATATFTPASVKAQEETDIVEELVITGTRREGLSPTETLSPIDVIGGGVVADQASFDLTDSLSKVTPSLNTQRFPIADGTSFIRPVTLRNLSPDQTLVLVNGTRRHRSALVNLQLAPLGTVNQGSQGVDFSTIPSAAIKRVEVLRDGASAQYGSDAIAGVVNIVLNDANEGINVAAQYGEYFEDDGERLSISLNGGFALGANGFLNATLEHSTSDITSRGNARPDAAQVASVVGAELTPLEGFGQRWGDPDIETDKLFINAGIDVSENVALYGNASYMDNETISDFFYRGPVLDPAQMFEARSTLQQDLDGDFLPDAAPQSLVDSITAGGLNPADYLVPDTEVDGVTSPSGFVLRNPIFTRFPGGYNPDFGADIEDYALVFGGRGETDAGFRWDIRARYAENEVEYVVGETINPSLGRLSPTEFEPGTLTQEETSVNADFVTGLEIDALASPVNIGFGFELRNETYEIGAGDAASITAGPTAAVFGVGSDGFQGFPEESSGKFESDSIGTYLDVEADITDRFSAGAAVRYEDFDEFGSTFDWKLSGRFEITDNLAARATANTGFRAPTPGQINTLNVTTTADTAGNLIPSGTYPVDNPVALVLGAEPLEPEESQSFTVGLVFNPEQNISVTLDYYDIQIEDRLALQNNTVTADQVAQLTADGFPNANLLLGSNANFFSNAFESNITGVDLAVTGGIELGMGTLTADWRHSWNEQEVDNVRAGTINESRVFDLENQVPNHRSVLTFSYATGAIFDGFIRFNYYGEWETTGGLFSPGDATDQASYDAETLVDIEARFTFKDKYTLALGGENIFDTEPEAEQDGTLRFLGVEYAVTSPFGFNGGFWYVRASASF